MNASRPAEELPAAAYLAPGKPDQLLPAAAGDAELRAAEGAAVPFAATAATAAAAAAAAALIPPAPSAVVSSSTPAEHVAATPDNRHARLVSRAVSVCPVAPEPPFCLE